MENIKEEKQLTEAEDVKSFLEGRDPEEYIVAIEPTYENHVHVITNNPEEGKKIRKGRYKPFFWFKQLPKAFYGGDRREIKKSMRALGVTIEALRTDGDERLENGYKYIAHCKKGYNELCTFFKRGGVDPWKRLSTS